MNYLRVISQVLNADACVQDNTTDYLTIQSEARSQRAAQECLGALHYRRNEDLIRVGLNEMVELKPISSTVFTTSENGARGTASQMLPSDAALI